MSEPNDVIIDRRAAPRYRFEAPVKIFAGAGAGTGMLRDMSISGARVDEVDFEAELDAGAEVKLEFSFYQDSHTVVLQAVVVRRSESGELCLRYVRGDARTRHLLQVLLPKVATARLPGQDEAETEATGPSARRVTLDPELHEAVAAAAEAQDVEVDEWVRTRLSQAADLDGRRVQMHRARRPTKSPAS